MDKNGCKWVKMDGNSNMPHPRCIGRRKTLVWDKKLVEMGPKLGLDDVPNFALRAHYVHGNPHELEDAHKDALGPSSCTACALRAYCGRRGWDTHPRIFVTCLVARRSRKAHLRTMKMPSRAFKGAKHPHAELRIYTCIGSSMCNCTLPFVFWELILASILKAFKHDFLQCFPSLVLRGAP